MSETRKTDIDYGLYRLVTAYREYGHQKANVDILQLKQTMLVNLYDLFVFSSGVLL